MFTGAASWRSSRAGSDWASLPEADLAEVTVDWGDNPVARKPPGVAAPAAATEGSTSMAATSVARTAKSPRVFRPRRGMGPPSLCSTAGARIPAAPGATYTNAETRAPDPARPERTLQIGQRAVTPGRRGDRSGAGLGRPHDLAHLHGHTHRR